MRRIVRTRDVELRFSVAVHDCIRRVSNKKSLLFLLLPQSVRPTHAGQPRASEEEQRQNQKDQPQAPGRQKQMRERRRTKRRRRRRRSWLLVCPLFMYLSEEHRTTFYTALCSGCHASVNGSPPCIFNCHRGRFYYSTLLSRPKDWFSQPILFKSIHKAYFINFTQTVWF